MAKRKFIFDVVSRVTVELDTSLVPDDEWRSMFYSHIETLEDVAAHIAYNAVANGNRRLNMLDGFADRSDDLAELDVHTHEPELAVAIGRAKPRKGRKR